MRVELAYKHNNYIKPSDFNVDILFYEQPWHLPEQYNPQNMSKYALTCYEQYGFPIFNNKNDYINAFHIFLWNYFIDSNLTQKRLETYSEKNV